MLQFDARILANEAVAPRWRKLVLEWPRGEAPSPGQFLTLRTSSAYDPLLRRPFAFASFRPGKGEMAEAGILYEVRGRGTTLLAGLEPGASVDALGPLGKGFPLPGKEEQPILLAGGVGLGPILFLATELQERAEALPPRFVVGFREAGLVPRIDFPAGTTICTDDGSLGFKGTGLGWIEANLPPGPARLYACGPAPMLAAAAALSRRRGIPASLSAEAWMACGVGACMGCALPRPAGAGYLRACHDGPVFERDDIDWEAIG